jgi:hypothetical protein
MSKSLAQRAHVICHLILSKSKIPVAFKVLRNHPSVSLISPHQPSQWALLHRPLDAGCEFPTSMPPIKFYFFSSFEAQLMGKLPHLLLHAPGELYHTDSNVLLSGFTYKYFVDL